MAGGSFDPVSCEVEELSDINEIAVQATERPRAPVQNAKAVSAPPAQTEQPVTLPAVNVTTDVQMWSALPAHPVVK